MGLFLLLQGMDTHLLRKPFPIQQKLPQNLLEFHPLSGQWHLESLSERYSLVLEVKEKHKLHRSFQNQEGFPITSSNMAGRFKFYLMPTGQITKGSLGHLKTECVFPEEPGINTEISL